MRSPSKYFSSIKSHLIVLVDTIEEILILGDTVTVDFVIAKKAGFIMIDSANVFGNNMLIAKTYIAIDKMYPKTSKAHSKVMGSLSDQDNYILLTKDAYASLKNG